MRCFILNMNPLRNGTIQYQYENVEEQEQWIFRTIMLGQLWCTFCSGCNPLYKSMEIHKHKNGQPCHCRPVDSSYEALTRTNTFGLNNVRAKKKSKPWPRRKTIITSTKNSLCMKKIWNHFILVLDKKAQKTLTFPAINHL